MTPISSFDYPTYFGFKDPKVLQKALGYRGIIKKIPSADTAVPYMLQALLKNIASVSKAMETKEALLIRSYNKDPLGRSIALVKNPSGPHLFNLYIIFSRYRKGDPVLATGGHTRVALAVHLFEHPQIIASLASRCLRAPLGLSLQKRFQTDAPVCPVIATFSPYHKTSKTLGKEGCYTRSLQPLYASDLAFKSALPWKTACLLMQDVLKALVTLHASSVIHADIKEDNILCNLTPRPQAVLIDLASSYTLADEPIPFISTTPLYLDPFLASLVISAEGALEHESYKGKLSFASDMWAVGMAFFRALGKGKITFIKNLMDPSQPAGRLKISQDILRTCRHAHWASTQLRAANVVLPEALYALLDHLLHPDPLKRISAEEALKVIPGLLVSESLASSLWRFIEPIFASRAVQTQTQIERKTL